MDYDPTDEDPDGSREEDVRVDRVRSFILKKGQHVTVWWHQDGKHYKAKVLKSEKDEQSNRMDSFVYKVLFTLDKSVCTISSKFIVRPEAPVGSKTKKRRADSGPSDSGKSGDDVDKRKKRRLKAGSEKSEAVASIPTVSVDEKAVKVEVKAVKVEVKARKVEANAAKVEANAGKVNASTEAGDHRISHRPRKRKHAYKPGEMVWMKDESSGEYINVKVRMHSGENSYIIKLPDGKGKHVSEDALLREAPSSTKSARQKQWEANHRKIVKKVRYLIENCPILSKGGFVGEKLDRSGSFLEYMMPDDNFASIYPNVPMVPTDPGYIKHPPDHLFGVRPFEECKRKALAALAESGSKTRDAVKQTSGVASASKVDNQRTLPPPQLESTTINVGTLTEIEYRHIKRNGFSVLQEVECSTGVKVTVEPNGDMSITGNAEAQRRAQRMINRDLSIVRQRQIVPQKTCATTLVENNACGHIMGGGRLINRIQCDSKTIINIPKAFVGDPRKRLRKVEIVGSPADVRIAQRMISQCVSEWARKPTTLQWEFQDVTH